MYAFPIPRSWSLWSPSMHSQGPWVKDSYFGELLRTSHYVMNPYHEIQQTPRFQAWAGGCRRDLSEQRALLLLWITGRPADRRRQRTWAQPAWFHAQPITCYSLGKTSATLKGGKKFKKPPCSTYSYKWKLSFQKTCHKENPRPGNPKHAVPKCFLASRSPHVYVKSIFYTEPPNSQKQP